MLGTLQASRLQPDLISEILSLIQSYTLQPFHVIEDGQKRQPKAHKTPNYSNNSS